VLQSLAEWVPNGGTRRSPDGAKRNPGPQFPHCAIGRRFAPARWLHAGYFLAKWPNLSSISTHSSTRIDGGESPRAPRDILIVNVAFLRRQSSSVAFYSDHQQLLNNHLFIMNLLVMNRFIVGLVTNALVLNAMASVSA
jgi:hypothetical protein